MASPSPLHAILFPMGTGGDVFPLIGAGAALRRRGHRVTVATNAVFESNVREAGLEFRALADREQFDRANRSELQTHIRLGFRHFVETTVLPFLRPQYDLLREHANETGLVAVGPGFALGPRVAREKLGIPLATMHLQANIFRSAYESPVMMGIQLPGWLPVAVKRAIVLSGHAMFVDPVIRKPLNNFRAELGLPLISRPLDRWWHSPDMVFGTFTDWFARRQPDWPRNFEYTGFEDNDGPKLADPDSVIPPQVLHFLKNGPPPVVATFGSGAYFRRPYFETAVAALQAIGKRGLLISGDPDSIPHDLPEGMAACGFIRFSSLLRHVSGIIHHGGIGTLTAAMRAGVPQVIVAFGHDQPDNARRIANLGLGINLQADDLTPQLLETSLRTLYEKTEYVQRCADIRQRIAGEQPGSEAIADRIEAWMAAKASQ